MSNPSRWLVLGAGSWLGYLLLAQESAGGEALFMGTVYHQTPAGLPPTVVLSPAQSVPDYLRLAESFEPVVIANFLRGEDAEGFAIHTAMADYCRNHGALYVHISSVLALDGYQNTELTEELPPRSNTPYGLFKGKCETYLKEKGGEWLVVRFASVQGWVPHKSTRNQKFLEKLSRGETVMVDTGVVQNRLAADWIIEALRTLVHDRTTGVVHLGATNASEEINFLRQEAIIFGWDRQLVVAGSTRPVNLDCRPGRIFQLYGTRFQRTEADTLNFLARNPGLQPWRNPAKP